ncbi:MAG TPA: NAD-dependent epimerase/dehydratase family protein [Acidimicrobiales bacterium]
MRILVTGGAGFIGANLVQHLVGRYPDARITVLDALTYAGNPANLDPVRDRVTLVHGDICADAVVDPLLADADAVVHLAAESHVTRSERDPEVFERTNVEGTRVLLEGAVRHGVGRFVHVSTDEVYGEAEPGRFFREEDKEPGDHQATSAYAKSKSRADDLVRSYADRLSLNVVRPTNNFGPYQFPEKAFPRWATRVLRGEPISLWGLGDQVRDWLYAPDTARAIELVLERGEPGAVYNVGANNRPEIANRDLAHWLMGRLHDHGATIEHQIDRREHHDGRYGVDTARIRALGWAPSPDVWQAFEVTTRWYVEHAAWWAPLVAEAERIYA